MTQAQILAESERRGVILRVDGEHIHYRGPAGAMTSEMRSALAAHKPKLVELIYEAVSAACLLLNKSGVRIMRLDGLFTIGIWSDLDCLDIRAALRKCGIGDAPIKYLDGPGVPAQYIVRRVAGEPVPLDVLHAMERNPENPWEIRDQMLMAMDWRPRRTWAQWERTRT